MNLLSKMKTGLQMLFPSPLAFYWQNQRLEGYQYCCDCLAIFVNSDCRRHPFFKIHALLLFFNLYFLQFSDFSAYLHLPSVGLLVPQFHILHPNVGQLASGEKSCPPTAMTPWISPMRWRHVEVMLHWLHCNGDTLVWGQIYHFCFALKPEHPLWCCVGTAELHPTPGRFPLIGKR